MSHVQTNVLICVKEVKLE